MEKQSEYRTNITEAEIQKRIFEFLVYQGFLVLRVNSGRKRQIAFVRWQALGFEAQTTGVSDLLALSPTGKLYAIETKKPGEKARANQSTFLAEAEKRGATPILATSLEDVISQL